MNNYTIKAQYDNVLGYTHAFLFHEEEATIDCEVRTINMPSFQVVLPTNYSEKIISEYNDDHQHDYYGSKTKNISYATTRSIPIDIARPRSEIKQLFSKYVATNRRLFKNADDNNLVLVFTESDGKCMTFAEAADKYGDKKLYAEIHVNALYGKAQPVRVFVF